MKKLPFLLLLLCAPVWAANDFSGDPNCVALYSFENGALLADTGPVGTNTLTDQGSGVADTVDFQELAASVDLNAANPDYYTRTNANLSSKFPGKNGTSYNKLSVTCWFKYDSITGTNEAFVCGLFELNKLSWLVGIQDKGANDQVLIAVGHSLGDLATGLNHTGRNISTGVWYHLGWTYDGSGTGDYQMRLYDSSNTTAYTQTDTNLPNDMIMEDSALSVGAKRPGGPSPWDGNIDEVVIFNDLLSIEEIDAIRGATSGAANGAGFMMISKALEWEVKTFLSDFVNGRWKPAA